MKQQEPQPQRHSSNILGQFSSTVYPRTVFVSVFYPRTVFVSVFYPRTVFVSVFYPRTVFVSVFYPRTVFVSVFYPRTVFVSVFYPRTFFVSVLGLFCVRQDKNRLSNFVLGQNLSVDFYPRIKYVCRILSHRTNSARRILSQDNFMVGQLPS